MSLLGRLRYLVEPLEVRAFVCDHVVDQNPGLGTEYGGKEALHLSVDYVKHPLVSKERVVLVLHFRCDDVQVIVDFSQLA